MSVLNLLGPEITGKLVRGERALEPRDVQHCHLALVSSLHSNHQIPQGVEPNRAALWHLEPGVDDQNARVLVTTTIKRSPGRQVELTVGHVFTQGYLLPQCATSQKQAGESH